MKLSIKYLFVFVSLLFMSVKSEAVYNPQVTNVYFNGLNSLLNYDIYASPLNTNNYRFVGGEITTQPTGQIGISIMVSDDRIWYVTIKPMDSNGIPTGEMLTPIQITPTNINLTTPSIVTGLKIVEIN